VKFTYWLALDPICFKAMQKADGAVKFIKAHQEKVFKDYDDDDIVFYTMQDQVPGFIWTAEWGLKYSTTAIAAAHLGKYMGAKTVFLVGFDCTYGMGLYQNLPDFEGLSRIPHWYDKRDHFSGYSGMWDEHFKAFAEWAESEGTEIVNLSVPTASKHLKRGDYRDYWRADNGRPSST
jgi:hypothetical protein